MNGDRDVVIVAGARTPFVKANTVLGLLSAVELGRIVVREAVERADLDPGAIDEVVVGNIAGPADAANIARVIALMAKIPRHVPAFTVNRNCASGMPASCAKICDRRLAGRASAALILSTNLWRWLGMSI